MTGRTIHDDDACLTLPILALPGVVLTPGQTVPLHLFEPTTVSMVRHILEGDRTFGLLTAR
jgi:cereblon